jgi:hypothetical protein
MTMKDSYDDNHEGADNKRASKMSLAAVQVLINNICSQQQVLE